MKYYTENYRCSPVLAAVSNRLNPKLVGVESRHRRTTLMACERTSENVALLNRCFFNKHRPFTWLVRGDFTGVFSLNNGRSISQPHYMSTSLASPEDCVISGCEKKLHLPFPKQDTVRDLISFNTQKISRKAGRIPDTCT